jgi:hypothetical protein
MIGTDHEKRLSRTLDEVGPSLVWNDRENCWKTRSAARVAGPGSSSQAPLVGDRRPRFGGDPERSAPDNCDYPWEDAGAVVHIPSDWTVTHSELMLQHAGRTALELIVGAIERLLE